MVKSNPELMAKLEEIQKDNDTRQWTATLASESVKINYPKHLAEYLSYRNQTVQQMIKNFKEDQIKESKHIQEFVNHMIDARKLAPSGVANYVSAVKNRLEYEGLILTKRIRIPNRHIHHTVANQVVPTKDQIIRFLQNA
ncbi:MAG: hypothetical protein WD650_04200, partial [Nitrosopumilaceae archaeon]